jgi:hypothetical protein
MYDTPGIKSLAALNRLKGDLSGVIVITKMSGLKSLDGLSGLTGLGKDKQGQGLVLSANSNLESATALNGIRTWKGC